MSNSFHKIYSLSNETYKYTAMVRHQGTTIAFAMDTARRIFYVVLALGQESEGKSDAECWSEIPQPLEFPREIVQVGYGVTGETAIPPSNAPDKTTRDFMSSTARLGALAPFQVLSDGVYVYLFRQATGFNDAPYMVYKKDAQGKEVTDSLGNWIPLVHYTLLVDRFVLAGSKLELRREVRFRRSRSKYHPQSDNDSLDSVDMEGQPFYEPTQELDSIGSLHEGRFTALILPTQIPGIQRWQIFANRSTDPTKIHSWNIERAEDGLFNTRGTQTGGIEERSFELGGRTITRGPAAQLYFEQEKAAAGYDQTPKPLKRSARVLLAVPTQAAGDPKQYVTALDFAVSASGRLAEAPPSLALGDVAWHDPQGRPFNVVLDSIQQLENRIGQINGILSPLALASLNPQAFVPAACDSVVAVFQERLSAAANAKYHLRRANETPVAGRMQLAVAFCAFATQVPGTLPVYRETPTGAPSSQYHFSTRSAADANNLGWTQTEVAFYAFTSQVGDSIPIHEETPTGALYTEFRYSTAAAAEPGWTRTQIAFYAYPAGMSESYRSVPIYVVGDAPTAISLTSIGGTPIYLDPQTSRLCTTGTGPAEPLALEPLGAPDRFALRASNGKYLHWGTFAALTATALTAGAQEAFELRRTIALKANNGLYVTADFAYPTKRVIASGGAAYELQRFELVLLGGNKVALRGYTGDYVCADKDLAYQLVANRGVLDAWETFEKVDLGNGKIALKACNGAYVCADESREGQLVADRGAIGPWETFEMVGRIQLKAEVPPVLEQQYGLYTVWPDAGGILRLYVEESGTAWFPYTESVLPPAHRTKQDLLEVRHLGYADGANATEVDERSNPFQRVGFEWGSAKHIFSGGGGIIYFVDASDNLMWYEHKGQNARVFAWSELKLIRNGWNYKHVFSAGNGVLYAVDQQDRLLWYFHEGWRTGTAEMQGPIEVRTGWNHKHVFSGGDGILYAVDQSYQLQWYRHKGQSTGDASNAAWEGPKKVGDGWDVKHAFSGGYGVVYLVTHANELRWFFHRGYKDGIYDWLGSTVVDTDWDFKKAFAALPGNPAQFELYKLDQAIKERTAKELLRQAEKALLPSDVALPMPQVHVDPAGMTIHGGVLKFAWTVDSPLLFDAATGRLALYFRGTADQFFVAYFDTNTATAQFELKTSDGTLRLGAAMAGPHLDDLAATISAGPDAATCTVTLVATGPGGPITETWHRVPRSLQPFADALNGNMGSPIFAGNLAGPIHTTTTTLTLAAGGLRRALSAGDTLLVGTARVQLANPASKGDTSVTIQPATLNQDAGDAVFLIPYDYVTHAAAALSTGSHLVVVRGGTFASVPDGAAARIGTAPTPAPQWVAASPGRALACNAMQWLTLKDTSRLPELMSDSDLTLEAWVKPYAVTRKSRIVSYQSASGQYCLALKPEGSGDHYQVIAKVGDKEVETQVAGGYLCGEWTHLAVAYRQSHALKFDGTTWLDCGADPTLDINEDLTIEVFLYVEASDLSSGELGILTKGLLDDGTGQVVPYSLYTQTMALASIRTLPEYVYSPELPPAIDDTRPELFLVFAFEDKDNRNYAYRFRGLEPGLHKLAITRRRKTKMASGVESYAYHELRLFIDEKLADTREHRLDEVKAGGPKSAPLNNQPLLIGKAHLPGCLSRLFKGEIGEVRVWNVARVADQIGSPISGREQGLVSWWRFEENQGNVAQDSKSQNHGRMKGGTAKWIANRDPFASRLTFYANGTPVKTAPAGTSSLVAGQFAIGAQRDGSDLFIGTLEDVRVWKVERTREQIEENLFRRLTDEKDDLLAYYAFDFEDPAEVKDYGFAGHTLVMQPANQPSSPAFFMSTAPIGEDSSAVRSALAGVKTVFHGTLHARPAVAEYGEMMQVAGGTTGSLRRAYSFLQSGKWHILSGYKVGGMAAEWIGQVQSAPQIIGYIEGAPPVPSENLTQKNPAAFATYSGASSVEITEADKVVYTFSSSRDAGFDMNIESTLVTGNVAEFSNVFGPIIVSAAANKFKVGLKAKFENSLGWLNDAKVSTEKKKNQLSKQTLEGSWENPSDPATRRFVPLNVGYALVQADTMDLFALRLKHTGALIAYDLRPNPDIPKDWNVIVFPLNSSYVKQGTLDGKVGLQADPSYPHAMSYNPDISYFKPIEGYRLKQWIRKREQELRAFYERGYKAGDLGRRQGPAHFSEGELGGDLKDPGEGKGPVEGTALDNMPSLEKQNLVNTYVWTAEGGFFSETESTTDVRQESAGGSYKFKGQAGLAVDFEGVVLSWFVGFKLDALFGGHLNLTVTKAKEATRSFEVKIDVSGERDIALRDAAGNIVWDTSDPRAPRPKNKPGKVDAYRFMTFFMQPREQHFDDFFQKVVDPIWLAQSSSGAAAALRGAQQNNKKPPCWRILHRVTYVSRILPDFADPAATPVEKALRAGDIDSNWALIQRLAPYVGDKTGNYAAFADAVHQALKAHLPEMQPHAPEIVRFLCLYYGIVDGIA